MANAGYSQQNIEIEPKIHVYVIHVYACLYVVFSFADSGPFILMLRANLLGRLNWDLLLSFDSFYIAAGIREM